MSDKHLRGPYGPEGASAPAWREQVPPLIAERDQGEKSEPQVTHFKPAPPSVSDLSAAFEAARKRTEATQPTEAELAASRVRCHVADAVRSLCAAVAACEELDDVEHLVNGLDTLKTVQLRLRKMEGSCESGNITT